MPLIIGTPPTESNMTQLGSLAVGSGLMTSKQILLSSTSSGLIVAANSNRRYLALMNNTGASVYLGSSNSVTVLNGFELTTGSALNIARGVEQYTGPLYGITINTVSTVSVMEI